MTKNKNKKIQKRLKKKNEKEFVTNIGAFPGLVNP